MGGDYGGSGMKKRINSYIAMLVVIAFAGWVAVAELAIHVIGQMELQPEHEMQRILWCLFGITALALVIAGLLTAVYIHWTITAPVKKLDEAMAKLSEGEPLTDTSGCGASMPELSRLGVNVDRTAQVLAQHLQQLENQQELLSLESERADLASAAKRTFLTRISHEIRTPMNGIIGMATVAELHIDEKERVLDALGKIDKSGKQLLDMLDDVLDMSMLESGRLDLTEENFRLTDTISHAVDLLRPMAQARQHRLTVETKDVQHDYVIGAPERVQAIFSNIIENSIKYTPKGGQIRVTIRELSSELRFAGKYEFVFEDNGIGRSKEAAEQIFEPFVRVWEDRRAGEIEGMGLGLALVKNIVQLMNGTIEMTSEPESGTRIVVTVHLKLQKHGGENALQPAKKEVHIEDFRKENYENKRILLAEDNELSREIVQELFGLTGIRVDYAENGQQAVMRIAESPEDYYQMVLMDVQMPVMDGYIATRMIRGLDRADVKRLPIVAMTALALDEDVREAMQAGMDDHVAKPLELKRIQEILMKWL